MEAKKEGSTMAMHHVEDTQHTVAEEDEGLGRRGDGQPAAGEELHAS
jgi:hypothetical protein